MYSFPYYLQLNTIDCDFICLQMIIKYYNNIYSLQILRADSFIIHEGE